MFEAPYDKMVCDSDLGDGGVYFYNEYFEWVSRNAKGGFRIFYRDIQDVKILYGRKKTVMVILNNGNSRNLYLYKAGSFRAVIAQAIERINGKPQSVKQNEPIKENELMDEDDISKL